MAVVCHMGEHEVMEKPGGQQGGASMNLYQVVGLGLKYRPPLLPPLRTKAELGCGFLSAPVGNVTICFMNALYIPTLMAWNAEVTKVRRLLLCTNSMITVNNTMLPIFIIVIFTIVILTVITVLSI